MTNRASRLLISGFLSVILNGCAIIQSKQGVLLRNKEHVPDITSATAEFPKEYGSFDEIFLRDLPIRIKVAHWPETHVLFIGPGLVIPLPILPWPPGIASRWDKKQRDESSEKVKVVLVFGSSRDANHHKSGHYHLNPQYVTLVVGDRTVLPSSVTLNGSLDMVKTANDGFNISVDAASEKRVEIGLTYDIPYADIRDAALKIQQLGSDNGTITVEDTHLENRRKIRLWWMWGLGI